MKLQVTEQGVMIPKELLGEVTEVEILAEKGIIVIVPQKESYSIWDLGKNPVNCDVNEASVNHDRYL